MVYGDQFDSLFDPVLPVPEDRIRIKKDEETLAIGPERTLTFLDSPGHAAHHFSIYDPISRGLFTGDTAGVNYIRSKVFGFPFYLPSTSPNQFDPEAMKASISRFQKWDVERIFFGHFGMSDEPGVVYDQVTKELDTFMEMGEQAIKAGEGAKGIEIRLKEHYQQFLLNKGVPENDVLFQLLFIDLTVCAKGIEHYLGKK